MPNHISNELNVSIKYHTLTPQEIVDAHEQLRKFCASSLNVRASQVEENTKVFTFEGVTKPTPLPLLEVSVPTPKEHEIELAEQNVEKYGYKDWYAWRIATWGTKWDAYEAFIAKNEAKKVVISFVTAWSPPLAYYEALSKLYPLLTISISYELDEYEDGSGTYRGGELVTSTYA